LATWLTTNLIRRANKIFRSASNTFKAADFVSLGEQEILPQGLIPANYFC
jgi:hypothetical protein